MHLEHSSPRQKSGLLLAILSTLILSTKQSFTARSFIQLAEKCTPAGDIGPHELLLQRREAVAAALMLVSLSNPASAATQGPDHEVAVATSKVLHQLQDRWAELDKKGAAGAAELVEELGGSRTKTFTVVVPEGSSVGVEMEDRRVTVVTSRNLGWTVGDVIEGVNGKMVEEEEDLVKETKAAKKQGGALTFTVSRLQESPFVSFLAALGRIYRDADSETQLVEPDQVADAFRDLKNIAGLAKDGIVEMPALKEQLDRFVKIIDTFAAV